MKIEVIEMDYFLLVCIICFAISAAIIGLRFHLSGRTKPTMRDLFYWIIPISFLIAIFIYGYIFNARFKERVIDGKIISVEMTQKATSFEIDTYKQGGVLGFLALGLAVGDSAHKGTRTSIFHFYKRDSAGMFREIDFETEPDDKRQHKWQWSYTGEYYHKKVHK